MIRQLMNSVDLLLSEKLAAIGFDRKERFIYTCTLERDALGWLGFPSRGDSRKLVLAINVGVLFQNYKGSFLATIMFDRTVSLQTSSRPFIP